MGKNDFVVRRAHCKNLSLIMTVSAIYNNIAGKAALSLIILLNADRIEIGDIILLSLDDISPKIWNAK